MATYRVNRRGVAKARELIDAGRYRARSRWAGGLIAYYYRAAEWEHTEVVVAAHKLLMYLDTAKA